MRLIVILIIFLLFLYFFYEKDVIKAIIAMLIFLVGLFLTSAFEELEIFGKAIDFFDSPSTQTPTSSAILTTKTELIESEDDFIIPDSDKRKIKEDDLKDLTQWELRIARNEIYARKGRIFDKKEIREYFKGKDWYKGKIKSKTFDKKEEELLSSTEIENINFIKKYEKSLGYHYN